MHSMAEPGAARQSRLWPKRAMAICLALLLGACSTVVPRGAPPPARVAPPPPSEQALPPGALPEDRARHRIALLVPLSGPNAAVGQSIANAAALALADTGGRDLRITNYDTGPGAAAAAARALADGNQLFLGPLLAADVRAVEASAAAARVPVISFSNDAGVSGDGVWLLGFSPAQSIERVVRYARSRGISRFAGLIPQGQYGQAAANVLIRTANAAGGSVVAMESYDRSPRSIAGAVAKLSKQRYDALLIADSGRIAVSAVPLVRKQGGAGVRLLGPELWNAEPGLNAAPAMAGAWFASVDDAMFRQMAERYRARYGRTPYRLASLGYDAVLLAVRIARDWQPGDRFPVDRLDDAGGFAGVDGAFRFAHGHVADRALAVHQLGPAGGSIVSPAAKAF